MQSTNPKSILPTLHLIRAGLASGMLTKEEIIAWADKIVLQEEQPDIFFIDLALLSSRSKHHLIEYFGDYLRFDSQRAQGGPLLGLLYQKYTNCTLNLEQTVAALERLCREAVFTDTEEWFIYRIDDFEAAQANIYGSVENIQQDVEHFLKFYQGYSLENIENWADLKQQVARLLEDERQLLEHEWRKQQMLADIKAASVEADGKPWWKFW
ncbi:hypothetical protein LRS06_18985 [Hymenobacter sp. J193]|uniref:hypothetical protein n=1 Tax=Hymenobacter sp. J193 TaxID=2898429 RepID=UPI002150A7A0|nr:hypothetical protein [Hymenobacter sp. J193]MCR5889816.1 hypothetical protein [Hymenobacter sp. J193]